MDECWERSIPFVKLSLEEIKQVFKNFNESEVFNTREIHTGCRNSHYQVMTSKGQYLLRISCNNHRNEEIVSEALQEMVSVPRLFDTGNIKQKNYLIYEYIEGDSLQSIEFDNEIIYQVAKNLAMIHQFDINQLVGFEKMNLPPFHTWFDLFLDNEYTSRRLGNNMVNRIKKLVHESQNQLREIDKHQSFIHCDYRPANMILDNKGRVYIVDWEYSGLGHTLADVGQFFRYDECFQERDMLHFELTYNQYAKVLLPPNWYNLAKLRDLINPLQMLGTKQNLPHKFKDLLNIINNTLNYFKY